MSHYTRTIDWSFLICAPFNTRYNGKNVAQSTLTLDWQKRVPTGFSFYIYVKM